MSGAVLSLLFTGGLLVWSENKVRVWGGIVLLVAAAVIEAVSP